MRYFTEVNYPCQSEWEIHKDFVTTGSPCLVWPKILHMHLRNKSFPLCMSITSCYSCPVSCSFARELFRINDIESPAYSGLPPRCSCDLHTGSRENQDHMHIKRSIKYYKFPYHHFQIITHFGGETRHKTASHSSWVICRSPSTKRQEILWGKNLQNTCIYRLSI